jgi:hypothetical protein
MPGGLARRTAAPLRASRPVRAIALAAGAGAVILATVLWLGARAYDRPGPSRQPFADGFDFVGYHDLEGRPAFKLALQVIAGRWYLYTSHFWDRGWSVLDVTDPSRPELLAFVPGPRNTATLQLQVADGLLLTALEKPNRRGSARGTRAARGRTGTSTPGAASPTSRRASPGSADTSTSSSI